MFSTISGASPLVKQYPLEPLLVESSIPADTSIGDCNSAHRMRLCVKLLWTEFEDSDNVDQSLTMQGMCNTVAATAVCRSGFRLHKKHVGFISCLKLTVDESVGVISFAQLKK